MKRSCAAWHEEAYADAARVERETADRAERVRAQLARIEAGRRSGPAGRRGPDRAEVAARLAAMGPRRLAEALGLRWWPTSGAGCKVMCPAHQERTPSASVALRGGEIVWHCHGCHAGGSAFDFIMVARGCSFSESIAEGERIA